MDPEELFENRETLKDLQRSNQVLVQVLTTDEGVIFEQQIDTNKLMDISVLMPYGVRYVINLYNEEFQVYEMGMEGDEELAHQLPFTED